MQTYVASCFDTAGNSLKQIVLDTQFRPGACELGLCGGWEDNPKFVPSEVKVDNSTTQFPVQLFFTLYFGVAEVSIIVLLTALFGPWDSIDSWWYFGNTFSRTLACFRSERSTEVSHINDDMMTHTH